MPRMWRRYCMAPKPPIWAKPLCHSNLLRAGWAEPTRPDRLALKNFADFTFVVALYSALRIEGHRRPGLSIISGPLRQTAMIGITALGKRHPGLTYLIGQLASTGSVADIGRRHFDVIEHERHLDGMWRAHDAAVDRRAPFKN